MAQGDMAGGTHGLCLCWLQTKLVFSLPMFSFLLRVSKALVHLLSFPKPTSGCLARPFPRTDPFPQSSRLSVGQLSAVFYVNYLIQSFLGVRNT